MKKWKLTYCEEANRIVEYYDNLDDALRKGTVCYADQKHPIISEKQKDGSYKAEITNFFGL